MAQVNATYELCVDLNRDLDFADTNEDISAYWKSMRWQLGASSPYDHIARTNTLDVVLNNSDGRFSPQHASGLTGFELGALLRLQVTYSATTRQHFIGWITEIKPVPGSRGRRETSVRAEGFFSRLFTEFAFLPVQQDKRYDEIIISLLEAVTVYPPGLVGWLLGEAGFSELGQTTRLGESGSYANLETGVNTFNYAGDNWSRGVSVLSALRDLMDTEGGLLYESRAGEVEAFNRHHWIKDTLNAVDATFTEGLLLSGGVKYRYGDYLANDIVVKYRPRSVGTSLEVLGTITQSINVPQGSSTTAVLVFDDGSGTRIGGYGVVCVANTDFTARAQEEGIGDDVTSSVTVSIIEGGSSCQLTFTNVGTRDAFIAPGSRVRGYKITDFGEQEYRLLDTTSIGDYGRQRKAISLRMLDDPEYAKSLAYWERDIHATPSGQIEGMTILANASDTLMTQALTRVIGDRITVSESQTGVTSTEYFIVGEKHTVANQYHHKTEWVLLPSRALAYWSLGTAGYGELGETTWLAF